MSFVGIGVILLFCVLISRDRKRISWRLVFWGLSLQYIFALLILKTYPEEIFSAAQTMFNGIYYYSETGAKFLFGSLAQNKDFVILNMGAVIIFVSSTMAVLNYLRVLPAIIYFLARLMQWTMRTSGAETLSAAMFVLMGIEVLTGIKSVLGRMTRSELFSVMTCFMATIAGSVMAVYVGIFGANAGYILTASLMNAPGGLLISKILVPETEVPVTGEKVEWNVLLSEDKGLIEAAATGAIDGLRLVATVGAVLLAFVSIIHLLDGFLNLFGTSFNHIGGYVFAPVAYILGIPWEDCFRAGNLLALKTVFNEWLAYGSMREISAAGQLSPRAVMILTYALCSFANFGSMAILIGGISALAPERRQDVVSMGVRALISGLAAGFLSAAIVGTLRWS